ncbi:MAG: hypothetical protein DMF98_10905 [Acidobacteria bacterium]|nr:MAG: hypothetical protein DMF98_10905 [Acidobacteriota bacterium]
MSPARVVLTAELQGGANDYEEFYCPSVEWDWGDGTHSESTLDCEPYEAGKSEIKRRFTVEHIFRAGAYKVMFRLKRRDRSLVHPTLLRVERAAIEQSRARALGLDIDIKLGSMHMHLGWSALSISGASPADAEAQS